MATESIDDAAHVLDLVRAESWAVVAERLGALHPADIADVIDSAPHDSRERLFSLLDDEIKPAVLAELEAVAGAHVVESLTNRELSEIVEEMDPDDAADLIGDLPEERADVVLGLMDDEGSEDVRKLLEYDEDTAGGIMTTDVVSMQGDRTVAEALEAIAYLDEDEPFVSAYTVDGQDHLIGSVSVWALLREKNRQRPLREIAQTKVASAHVNVDQEEVARLLTHYDLSALPVVDDDGVLVGRVTVDDIIDVVEEEASEDIFRLAGSDDAELDSWSPLKSCAVRLPWLLMTLLGGFVTSLILKHFHARLSEIIILAAFVPIVLAMGGNTGIQSSTLIVRRIALGTLEGRSVFRLLSREIMIGALMGLVCGLVMGAWAHFVIVRGMGGHMLHPVHLAAVVGLALFSAMTFAAMFGALVPILLDRFRIDPAVASGPFITITNDISALLIYFAVTIGLVQQWS